MIFWKFQKSENLGHSSDAAMVGTNKTLKEFWISHSMSGKPSGFTARKKHEKYTQNFFTSVKN